MRRIVGLAALAVLGSALHGAAQEPAGPTAEAPAAAAAVEPAADEVAPEAAPSEAAAPAESAPADAPAAPTAEEPPADAPPAEVASEPEVDADADAAEEESAPAAAGTDWGGLLARAPKFLALTHHAAVHLPIALWLFGALFVVLGVVFPSWRNQVPLACLVGGALSSVPAAASGWWYADFEYGEPWAWGDGFGDWSEHLVKHRWLGFALALASIGLSALAIVSQARGSRRLGVAWRVGLLLLAAAVAWEGHLGGELIHGEGFLEEAFQQWVSPEPEE